MKHWQCGNRSRGHEDVAKAVPILEVGVKRRQIVVETAYSDERAEAFRAYMCLYGYKAAIGRCDWGAARRWFSEKEGERERATGRKVLSLLALALSLGLLLLAVEVPRPLGNVMEAGALIAMIAGAMTLVQFKEDTFDELPPSIRDDILSHFFMSDAEITEIEAEKEQVERQIERSREELEMEAKATLAKFNGKTDA